MPGPLPSSKSSTFDDQLKGLKAEVDALQIDAMRKSAPWYGNASTLIAAFALLISLGSTIFAYVRNIEQDNRTLRAELRTLILRLNDLPLKNHELQQQYEDPLVAGSLSGIINSENLILSTQAAEIIEKIPALVSGSEVLTVAVALRNSNQFQLSTNLLLDGLEISRDAESTVSLLRSLGANSYYAGDFDSGQEYYKKALDVFERSEFRSLEDTYYEGTTHALTEMFWAQTEAIVGRCDAWKEHLENAYLHNQEATSVTPEFDGIVDPIKSQIEQTESIGCNQ